MARTPVTTTIDLSGPFFTKDPRKTFKDNIRTLMEAVAKEAEADVRAQMQAGEGSRAPITVGGGRVSEHVVGRVVSLRGKHWSSTAVASVNNSGLSRAAGISLMAAASNVERKTGAFRRTTSRMRKARALNTVELLKGING